MENVHYPEGIEEQLLTSVDMENYASPPAAKIRKSNAFGTTQRTWTAIRQEIVLTIFNSFQHRLHEDQTERIQQYCKLFQATAALEMIAAGKALVSDRF